MTLELPFPVDTVKGFLHPDEGEALYRHAQIQAPRGPLLEIGSYCGKSTLYLGLAARNSGGCVFAVDHHRGSEEHQPGEFFHDAELFDAGEATMDSFREFRRTLRRAELEDTVIPVVAGSALAARQWRTPLAMVFIDGGHSLDAALADYRNWAGHVQRGGILAIHDIYDSAESGGQAPRAILKLALASGLFRQVERVESLVILQRL